MEGLRGPYNTAKRLKSTVWEERHRYGSSRGMTEEQVKRWSKHEEPEHVSEGGLSRIYGVDSKGMYSEGRADDDRYRRGAEDFKISTSGGGMSMVAGGSSSRPDAYWARMGEAD